MVWLGLINLATNENKLFKLALKTISADIKAKVAKRALILQQRMNLVKDFTGSIHMLRQ